jgi:hypothetical protein
MTQRTQAQRVHQKRPEQLSRRKSQIYRRYVPEEALREQSELGSISKAEEREDG